jgi:hypothetical protein
MPIAGVHYRSPSQRRSITDVHCQVPFSVVHSQWYIPRLQTKGQFQSPITRFVWIESISKVYILLSDSISEIHTTTPSSRIRHLRTWTWRNLFFY